jgi:hypothetical protein
MEKLTMLNKPKISAKLRKAIDKELEIGESVVWVGQPLHRFFTLESLIYFCMGIPFTAIAIYFIYDSADFKIPDLSEGIKFEFENIFFLFAVPFVLIGVWMLSSPLREWFKAFRTVYLITDKRAILIESGLLVSIRNYAPNQLKDLYRKEKRNGTGHIIITTGLRRGNDGDYWREDIGFMNIRNPKEVEKLLRQLAKTEVS